MLALVTGAGGGLTCMKGQKEKTAAVRHWWVDVSVQLYRSSFFLSLTAIRKYIWVIRSSVRSHAHFLKCPHSPIVRTRNAPEHDPSNPLCCAVNLFEIRRGREQASGARHCVDSHQHERETLLFLQAANGQTFNTVRYQHSGAADAQLSLLVANAPLLVFSAVLLMSTWTRSYLPAGSGSFALRPLLGVCSPL